MEENQGSENVPGKKHGRYIQILLTEEEYSVFKQLTEIFKKENPGSRGKVSEFVRHTILMLGRKKGL